MRRVKGRLWEEQWNRSNGKDAFETNVSSTGTPFRWRCFTVTILIFSAPRSLKGHFDNGAN